VKARLLKILPYTLKTTNDLLTSNAGLLCVAELMQQIGFSKLVDEHFPQSGSNRGYKPSTFVSSMMLMLHQGGDVLDDIRYIGEDKALLKIIALEAIPKAGSIGYWLRRMGATGVEASKNILTELVSFSLGKCKAVTLDIDATLSASKNKEAQWTYKKCTGYMPMVGHIAETSQVIAVDFRKGNVPPSKDNLAFIEQCEAALPLGVKLKCLRIDAAGYQYSILDKCINEGIEFAIRAKMSKDFKEDILEQKESDWVPMKNPSGDLVKGESVCHLLHCMNNSEHAFEVVVQRKQTKGQQSFDIETGEQTESMSHGGYIYRAIATNSKKSDVGLVHWYNQRAEDSENRIKELKNDFGAQKMPCQNFDANALYFSLCAIAYNLFALLRAFLPGSMHSARAKKVRLRLYGIAGKVVRHGRRICLQVQSMYLNTLSDTLKLIREFKPSQ